MPLMRCVKQGRKGYKFGEGGFCFVGTNSREKAEAQGRAIQANKNDAKVLRREDLPKSVQVSYRQQSGTTIGQSYNVEIKKLLDPLFDIVQTELDDKLPRILKSHEQQTKLAVA